MSNVPELGKTGPDQECPVNETVDEEEEDPGLQDDGAIENDLQDEDYKPPVSNDLAPKRAQILINE